MKSKQNIKASVRMFKEAAEVGNRLRLIRDELGLPQWEASLEIGITRERLANYEDGRTPLKVDVGLRACRTFIISEKWLATGEGDPRKSMNLYEDAATKKLRATGFFATAYKETLAARYEELHLQNQSRHQIRLGQFGSDNFYDQHVMDAFFGTWYSLLGPAKISELMRRLIALGDDFTAKSIDVTHLELVHVADQLGAPTFVTKEVLEKYKQILTANTQPWLDGKS